MAAMSSQLVKMVARQALPAGISFSRLVLPATARATVGRAFANTEAGGKVVKVLAAELKHEQDNYEELKDLKSYLKKSPFELVEKDGDANMVLERKIAEKTVRIEWQLSSPFDPDMDMEGGDGESPVEANDFMVTVENKNGAGLIFYCSTQGGEEHRYVIGNVKTFTSLEERDSISSYHGPEFEDLDDKLQESFDEYLAELGMNNEVCNFVDAMAVDKEQREYVNWLKTANKFLGE